MTDQALDMLMRRVLIDALRKDEECVIEVMESFTPSRKHQRQMEEMLQDPLKWMRNKTRPVWKTIAQKVAVILLIASVSLGGVMAVSPTVRAAVIQWMTEWYETHVVYRFFGESPENETAEFRITIMPHGYKEIEDSRIVNDNYVSLWYEDGDGNVILFDYMYMQEGAALLVEPEEGDTIVDVIVNDNAGQLYCSRNPEKFNTLVWTNQQSGYCFVIKAMCEEKEILRMAESVNLVE
jgi:hypothetical protein